MNTYFEEVLESVAQVLQKARPLSGNEYSVDGDALRRLSFAFRAPRGPAPSASDSSIGMRARDIEERTP